MYRHIHAVALRTIKYNDRNAILTAWSAEMGRVSLLMPNTATRESRRRRALTMPLSIFEGEVDDRPNRDIHTIRDMRPQVVTLSVSADFSKAAIAMFIAECLDNILRESAVGDAPLWELILDTVITLEKAENTAAVANMHLWFLYRLCVIAGVEPDMSTYAEGRLFDLRSGTFRASAPGHNDYIEAAQTPVLYALSRLNARSLHLLRLTAEQRNDVLDAILHYCTLHALNPGCLKTLDVLRSIFH